MGYNYTHQKLLNRLKNSADPLNPVRELLTDKQLLQKGYYAMMKMGVFPKAL